MGTLELDEVKLLPLKKIELEAYDIEKMGFLNPEYAWKAVFRVISTSNSIPEFFFVVVSNRYRPSSDLQVGLTQEVLDVLEVVKEVERRCALVVKNSDIDLLDNYFIVDL